MNHLNPLMPPIAQTQSCLMLPEYGIIQITGDALPFLQGQLTLDVCEITETQSRFGGYCNLKGRLHALYFLVKPEYIQGYWMLLPQSILAHTLNTLKSYARFSKVTLTDVSNQYGLFAYHGTAPLNDTNTPVTLGQTTQKNQVIQIGLTNELWFICGAREAVQELWDTLASSTPVAKAWDWLCIQTGIPSVHPETIEHFLPHYLNLDRLEGISFKKGCYLGQEIIARMQYKAEIKKHLYTLILNANTLFEPGTPLLHPLTLAPIGDIVSSSITDNNSSALVSMQDGYPEQDIMLENQNYQILELKSYPISAK